MKADEIKNLVLVALASDDMLLETLVLKGGNAISLLERGKKDSISRASYDLDYSMENDFDENLEEVQARFAKTLSTTFNEQGYQLIDYTFSQRPSAFINPEIGKFWGGYNIQFKLVPLEEYNKQSDDIEALRKLAVKVLPNQSPKVEIEISKYEYVGQKMEVEVDGFIVYIYTPEMIVFEKIRAICQQLPAYADIVPSHSPRPRARDFYDIHMIAELHKIDFSSPEYVPVIKAVFEAKRVPLEFIKKLGEDADIHRKDWRSVIDTVSAKEEIKDFEYYYQYVIDAVAHIPLG